MTLEELEAYALRMEGRIQTIEDVLTQLATAVNNLASLQQLRQVNLIYQASIDDIESHIAEIETNIELLKTTVFK